MYISKSPNHYLYELQKIPHFSLVKHYRSWGLLLTLQFMVCSDSVLVLWEQVHWRCTMSKGGGLLIMCPCTCKLLSLYMQTTVPVHANYCPCTCKCRLLSPYMQAGYCPRTCRLPVVFSFFVYWETEVHIMFLFQSTSCFREGFSVNLELTRIS